MKHLPLINLFRSACQCGKWQGPAREQRETHGEFTLRAFEAWQVHAHASAGPAARHAGQYELLDQGDLF